jgi:hypothetical protein
MWYQIIPKDGQTYLNIGGSDISTNVLNLANGSSYFRVGTEISIK